jgi:hypothetical protein
VFLEWFDVEAMVGNRDGQGVYGRRWVGQHGRSLSGNGARRRACRNVLIGKSEGLGGRHGMREMFGGESEGITRMRRMSVRCGRGKRHSIGSRYLRS